MTGVKYMKSIICCLTFIYIFLFTGLTSDASVRVRGSSRSNGTYVQPHYRSSPDHSRFNNWSTKGNYNPHTGKKGTVDPYKSYGNHKKY